MKQVLLNDVCEINPAVDKSIGNDMECTFVPMEYVDEVSGTIAKTAIRHVEEVKRGYTYFRNDDVIFAKITPCMENGKCAVARDLKNGVAFGSTEFHVIRAKGKIIPEWIYYYLRQEHIRQSATHWFRGTAGQQRVPATFLKELKIPLPPLPEQRRIAALLAHADHLRRLRRYADSLSASLLQSVFLEMFGNPKSNSKHWQIAKFSDVCESRLGKMLDGKQQTGKHLRPYLRNVNVQWAHIDLSDVAQMDFDEKDREEFRLRYGDVLICEGGEVGRSAIWQDEMPECYFQKALHRARPNPKLAIPDYIIWLMFMMAQTGGLGDFTSQVTIAHLTGEKLKELVIPVPPLPEQERFARLVRRVESLRQRQGESARQGEGLFRSLLHEAFRE